MRERPAKERVVTFGEGARLVGIASQPAAIGPGLPGVVLLNAGLLHRVGPSRLNVELARELAGLGYPCLRFDLAGLGDSEARRDRRSEVERAVLDIQQAMSFFGERAEIERGFVLIGLCSGADNAHLTAVADPRVVGLVLLDPYGYRTPGFYARHYAPRVLSAGPWLRFARRKVSGRIACWLGRAAGGEAGGEPGAEMFERYFPAQAEVAQQLEQLSARGVAQLLRYTGGVREEYFNDQGQFEEMFPGLDHRELIEVDYDPLADHVYTLEVDRRRLSERVRAWLTARFSATSSGVA